MNDLTSYPVLSPAEGESADEAAMAMALEEARAAAEEDEVPVGALIVCGDRIVSLAHNRREQDKCATAHAEILAIEEACRSLGGWRLPDTTLYVTLEPCPMCAGAIINARIPRVVFAAPDSKAGAFGSALDMNTFGLNHRPSVRSGVREEEAVSLLKQYFRKKRG